MEYFDALLASTLFEGISKLDLEKMLHCLAPKIQKYKKDALILNAGDNIRSLGIVLKGQVLVVQEDYWGNRNILAALGDSALFAESFAACPQIPLSVSVLANNDTAVLFLDYDRVVSSCPHACPHHRRMIENLLKTLAAKNQVLNEKLTHISQRSTREKLLSYLSSEAQRKNSAVFEIPFNRQQLADYLCVDRSALSAELSRLKRDGWLDYHRGSFKILRSNP